MKVKSPKKLTVDYLLSRKQQTDTVEDELVNVVEHLAAKEQVVPSGKSEIKED